MSLSDPKNGPIFTEFQSPLPERKPPVVIRRKPLWQRIVHSPGDFYLQWMERYELMDWAQHAQALSWPAGIALNLLFLCTHSVSLGALDFLSEPASVLALRASSHGPVATYPTADLLHPLHLPAVVAWLFPAIALHQWVMALRLALATVSLLNALYLFKRTKVYHILEVDPKHLPKSENIRQVLLDESIPNWAQHFPGNVLWSSFLMKWTRKNPSSKQKTAYELSIWDISVFHQNFFCLFSPLQVFVFFFFDMDLYTIILLILLPTMLFYVFEKVHLLLADKQLLFSHVLLEYNQKFIHPHLFYQRRDVGTSTSEPVSCDSNGHHAHPSAREVEVSPSETETPTMRNPFQAGATARKRLFT